MKQYFALALIALLTRKSKTLNSSNVAFINTGASISKPNVQNELIGEHGAISLGIVKYQFDFIVSSAQTDLFQDSVRPLLSLKRVPEKNNRFNIEPLSYFFVRTQIVMA